MLVLAILMLVGACFVGLPLGLLLLSQATMGVGILAASCLVAVVARMFQAGAYHEEMLRRLDGRTPPLRQP